MDANKSYIWVLILIVVDNGLVPIESQAKRNLKQVLILIVMYNGLVLGATITFTRSFQRLNPCCCGLWSRTEQSNNVSAYDA